MKIHLISDCHLNFEDLELPGGDVLIMAGDIVEAGHLRISDNLQRNTFLADRYRRFLKHELAKYRHVIYVLGNHEHYNNVYFDTFERIKKELPGNVYLLEAESITIDDVHFFGGTFWTDMNKRDPLVLRYVDKNLSDFSVIKHNSFQVKNIYGNSYYTDKFSTSFVADVFTDTVTKLKDFLLKHKENKVVVISHHAPCQLSINEKYKDDFPMNYGYFSDLSNLILDNPQIKTWVHGHMHDSVDYMLGKTRVICNPRGYQGYEDQTSIFDPNFTFEV